MAKNKIILLIYTILLLISIYNVSAFVSVSGDCGTGCTITSPYYSIIFDNGVIKNQTWHRTNNIMIPSTGQTINNNFGSVLSTGWKMGESVSGVTCTTDSSNISAVNIYCSSIPAYSNWTFYSSYIKHTVNVVTGTDYRVYYYTFLSTVSSPTTIVRTYNSTTLLAQSGGWSTGYDTNGLGSLHIYNYSNYTLTFNWDKSVTTNFDWSDNFPSVNYGGVALGRSSPYITIGTELTTYIKSLTINTSASDTQRVLNVQNAFNTSKLYGDDYNDIAFVTPTPTAGNYSYVGIFVNTTFESVEDFSSLIDFNGTNRLLFLWNNIQTNGTCYDNSSKGTSCTLINFAASTSAASIRFNKITLDGQNDYVSTGSSQITDLTGNITITAWINSTNLTSTSSYTTFQEDADYTSMTGVLVDGDYTTGNYWDTDASLVYMNYTKPVGAVGAIWTVKDSDEISNFTHNYTLPQECFDNININIEHQLGGGGTSYKRCWNGTEYISLTANEDHPWLYEEAMYWNFSGNTSTVAVVGASSSYKNYPSLYISSTPNEMLSMNYNNGTHSLICTTNNTNITYTGWNHIGSTYDGTNIKLYLNGVLQRTCGVSDMTISTAVRNTSSLNIGYSGSLSYFNGSISAVRIDTRAISAVEMAADYNSTTNTLYANNTGMTAGTYTITGKTIGTNGGPVGVSTRSINVHDDGTAPNISIFTNTSTTYRYNDTVLYNIYVYDVATNVSSYRFLYGLNTSWQYNQSLNVNSTYKVYEETYDETDCVGGYSNLVDGDWSTSVLMYTFDKEVWKGSCLVNYTKPALSIGATWQVKDDGTFADCGLQPTRNVTIPDECWDADATKLLLNPDEPFGVLYWKCWNSTAYITASNTCSDARYMFEEGIYWDINAVNITQNITINATRGQQWCSQIEVPDFYGNLATQQLCFNVTNTPPVITSVFTSPSPALESSNITCNYTATDIDSDNVTVVTTNWTINNVINGNHNNTLPYTEFTAGDVINCSIYINDSYDITSWSTSSSIVIGDVTPPNITEVSFDNTTVYTDENHNITVNCSMGGGSGIAAGYPKFTYIDPDDIIQGNYSMISLTGEKYYYPITYSKEGTYTNFSFYCSDAQNNIDTELSNITVTSETRPSPDSPGSGGGGTVIVSSATKDCNWKTDKAELVIYKGESVSRLIIYNNENFSITPTYATTSGLFEIAGAKEILTSGSVTELTILKSQDVFNSSLDYLTISSGECRTINVTVRFTDELRETSFATGLDELFNMMISKILSKVDFFGYTINYYYIFILTIIIAALIVMKADANLLTKIIAAAVIVLLLNLVLGSIFNESKINTISSLNNTDISSLSVIPTSTTTNAINKTNESVSLVKMVFTESITDTSIGGNNVHVYYWFIWLILFMLITAILFAATNFDTWAKIVLGAFISLVIILITWGVVG